MSANRLPCLLLLLTLAAPLRAGDLTAAKLATTRRVFGDLVRAIGDGRPAPALHLQPAGGGDVAVAWYDGRIGTVVLDEGAYDVCASLGADSLAALAVLLGHELAHCYRDHGWLGDFGNGYADLDVGQRLAAVARAEERVLVVETEADHFGGFYGYMAGYNTLGVAPRLLSAVYAAFELGEEIPGYPSLPERRAMARKAEEQLARLVPVFDAGQLLLAIGHLDQAAACFDHIAATFPSREILNNSGVAYASMALELFPSREQPFAWPLEVDAHTRLAQGRTRAGGGAAARRRRQELLSLARQRFTAARARDPAYATALVNLACVAALGGDLDQAAVHAEAAANLAAARGELQTAANALVARGIARALGARGEAALAAADFEEAAAGNPAVAALNLAVLRGGQARSPRGDGAKPAPVREAFVGPTSAVYERLASGAEQSVSIARGRLQPLFLLSAEVDGGRGLLLDDPELETLTCLWTPPERGRTARGLRRLDHRADMMAAYGAPDRVLAWRQHTAHVYEDARILFRTDLDDRVAGWTLFYHEPEFYESPLADAPEPATPPGRPAERRVALVVGNDRYAEAPLRNAASDALAMADSLRRLCGFEVAPVVDADRRALVDAIRQFGADLEGADVGLFFYAGHAVEVGGVNYLVPIGADVTAPDEVPHECVAVDRLLGKMKAAANDVNLIILDACRNNPYAGRFRSLGANGLAAVENPPRGSFVAFATAPGEVAEDGAGDHSLFTASILRHLRTPGMDVSALFMEVAREVSEATGERQLPWRNSSLTAPFYFVPPGDTPRRGAHGFAALPPQADGSRVPGRRAALDDEVLIEELGIYVDRYEVTAAQFAAFLQQRDNREEDGVPWLDLDDPESLIVEGPDGFAPRPGYGNHPVVAVTWHGARAYCRARGKRLPTAQEWRRAALGSDGRRYPWGDESPDAGGSYRANYHQGDLPEDGYAATAPVGSFPAGASASGLYDVAGNVWEWAAGQDGVRRPLMGGSWYSDADRLGGEYWRDAALATGDAGFRCARDR